MNYVMFFGHTKPNGYLSQWYPCTFTKNDIVYSSAEQYMMYMKAMLFNDRKVAKEILKTTNQKEIKALGRKVKNFNQTVWDQYKVDIVTTANYLKFSQNPDLKNNS